MTKRKIRTASPFLLFDIYSDMLRAGMQSANLMTASAEVIAYRSEMINRTLSGELPYNHTEFAAMWHEKILAGMQSWSAALKHASGTNLSAMPDLYSFQSQLKGFTKAMAPYQTKATANALRLRKKRAK